MKKIFLFLIFIIFLFGCENQIENNDLDEENFFNNSENIIGDKIEDGEELFVEEEINDENFGKLEQETFEPCKKPVFTSYFVEPEKVQKLGQIGFVHGSGQHLVGRSYVSFKEEYDKIPVYAPANMTLYMGAYHTNTGAQSHHLPDYALDFNVGCGLTLRFDHLKEVVPKISVEFPEPKIEDSRSDQKNPVSLEAGELVGYFIQNVGVAGMDILVHDEDVNNEFGSKKRHEFGHGSLMLHAVCPYDFFVEDIKEEYYSLIGGASGTIFKNQTCGNINRNYEGTISGEWFLEKEVTKNIYDYSMEGDYGSLLPIIGDEEKVTIGRIGKYSSISIYKDFKTYKLPSEVTDEHCYEIHINGNPNELEGYVYLKIVDDETLNVYYSEKGKCSTSFPTSEYKTYYR